MTSLFTISQCKNNWLWRVTRPCEGRWAVGRGSDVRWRQRLCGAKGEGPDEAVAAWTTVWVGDAGAGLVRWVEWYEGRGGLVGGWGKDRPLKLPMHPSRPYPPTQRAHAVIRWPRTCRKQSRTTRQRKGEGESDHEGVTMNRYWRTWTMQEEGWDRRDKDLKRY